jgi:NADH-quinone oxidoreductase subunit N
MTKNNYLPEQLLHIIDSISVLAPEVLLSIVFLLLIGLDLLLHKATQTNRYTGSDDQKNFIFLGFSLLSVVLSLNQVSQQFYNTNDTFLFGGMLMLDAKAIFFKILILLSAIFTFVHIYITKRKFAGEFYPIMISMIIGLNLMTMAVNLLVIYLTIEIVSIASYVLTAFDKTRKSTEAGLKYIIFGATASAVMLYGMSLLYGMTGTLNIAAPEFSRGIAQVDTLVATIAIVLTISGFLFKISASPFHIWTPDVYESAPTPVIAFFSVAPKIAGFLIIIRFYSALNTDLQTITAMIALASITFGNFSALWQNNVRRMLAYSTIAHTGFMLIGVVTMSKLGLTSIVFYLVVSMFTNFAAFLMIDYVNLSQKNVQEDAIEAFKGLGRVNPFFGILMLIIMISLAGLPPTAGFFAKLNIFSALWENYQTSNKSILLLLLAFGLFNTVVSLFFYLKIPFFMFFKEASADTFFTLSGKQYFWGILLTLPILILFFKADWLMTIISYL